MGSQAVFCCGSQIGSVIVKGLGFLLCNPVYKSTNCEPLVDTLEPCVSSEYTACTLWGMFSKDIALNSAHFSLLYHEPHHCCVPKASK